MGYKHKIFLGIALLIIAAGIALSLKRSVNAQNPAGEIKHFPSETIQNHPKAHANVSEKDQANMQDMHAPSDASFPSSVVQQEANISSLPAPTAENPSEEVCEDEGILITHKVISGESLLGLAKRYHTTAYLIAKRNMISEDTMLDVGDELEIIPGEKAMYQVQQGDSLAKIGQYFHLDQQAIATLNDLEKNATVRVGQRLLMPIRQKKIDAILAAIDAKRQEKVLQRKSQYRDKLLTRLKRQQELRDRLAAKARVKKLEKARKEKLARLAKAKRNFKYTSTKKYRHKKRVVATAYTSHRSQTDSTPFLAAWNNRIRPGMRIIAVSPDMIRKYGLTNGVRVKIGGLPGTYVVRDKMNPRLHNHIDIYMGTNRRRALRWGRRRVVLYW